MSRGSDNYSPLITVICYSLRALINVHRKKAIATPTENAKYAAGNCRCPSEMFSYRGARNVLMTMIRKVLFIPSSCRPFRASNSPRRSKKGRPRFRRSPAENAARKVVKHAVNARKVPLSLFAAKLNVQASPGLLLALDCTFVVFSTVYLLTSKCQKLYKNLR